MYALKVVQLSELEKLYKQGLLDLFYADESHVCSEAYVPYGWQFPGERVFMPAQRGYKLNLWSLLSRDNTHHWATSETSIDAHFVFRQLEERSLNIRRPTVVVLDNASIHHAKIIAQQQPYWEARGLYLFYLPTYSPHLNIAETLWRKLKKEQLDPADYVSQEHLHYAVNRCLAQLGHRWTINFSDFNIN